MSNDPSKHNAPPQSRHRHRHRRHLSPEDRAEVVRLLAAGGVTQAALAERFGVSVGTIARLKRRGASPRSQTTSGEVIHVRLSAEELEGFDAAWREAGLASRSDALRRLIRNAADLFEPDHREIDHWREVADQLRGVAGNINQMAKQANRNQLRWTEAEAAEIASVNRAVVHLTRRLRSDTNRARQSSAARRVLQAGRQSVAQGMGMGQGGRDV